MSASFKVACLLAVAAVVVCTNIPGGYQDIGDSNSAIVNTASQMAKDHLMGANNACDAGLHRVSAQQQIVNGINYKFAYTVDPTQCGGTGPAQTCTVVVFVSRDQSQKTVSGSSCQ